MSRTTAGKTRPSHEAASPKSGSTPTRPAASSTSGLSGGVFTLQREPRTQIKTRERVRSLAEVYTHEREVNAMLDLVADMFPHGSIKTVDKTFLEPACGSGNFLEEILRRKLAGVRSVRHAQPSALRLMRKVLDVVGQPVLRTTSFPVPDGFFTIVAVGLRADRGT